MTFDIVSLLAGLVIGAAAVFLFSRGREAALRERVCQHEQARETMGSVFASLAQDVLVKNNEQFIMMAQERLKAVHKDGAHDLEKRQIAIAEMMKPVQKHLEILGSTVEQIKGTDLQMREDMKNLTRETAKLAGAMRDPTAQGRWGEYILERLLESSGLTKGIHYEMQVANGSTGQRPDAIVNLSDKLKIVVDAKTPLNEFTALLDRSLTEEEAASVMKDLAAQVGKHITALSKKNYWDNIDADSVDFTILFLPSEQLFSMALRGDPDLAELAASKNVIVASPTLMMALMRVIRTGWKQAALADNAKAISEQGAQLYQRLHKFIEHFEKIGKGLSGALDSYNNAVGSMDRMVLPATRKLQDMGVQDGGKTIADLTIVEETPRRLTGTDGNS